MATKKIVDAIPPVSGREYKVTTLGNGNSKIEDVTQYEQEGSTFGAKEVLEGCFVECDYEWIQSDEGIGWHLLTTENQNPKNIKFFATHDFNKDDVFALNGVPMRLEVYGNPLSQGVTFYANSEIFGFINNNRFYLQSPPPVVNRIIKEEPIKNSAKNNLQTKRTWSNGRIEFVASFDYFDKNKKLTDYATSLMNSGFKGVIPFTLGEGSGSPTGYCNGEMIIDYRSTIIVYGLAGAIYYCCYGDGKWGKWFKVQGTAI